jgi:predicted transcriptional regulator
MAKELGDLAVGIAMARSKPHITRDEIKLIQQMALHSITLKRIKFLHVLLNTYPDWITVNDVSEEMGFSENSVSRWFQDLLLLNIVEKHIVYSGPKLTKTHEFRILQGQMLKRILSI